MTATIASRGPVVLPKAIQAYLHVRPGSKMEFVVRHGEVIIRPAAVDIRSLRGILKSRRRKPVSLKEMDQAIACGAMRSMRNI